MDVKFCWDLNRFASKKHQYLRSPKNSRDTWCPGAIASLACLVAATIVQTSWALDENGNGIEDGQEMDLARKFVPVLQLHPYGYSEFFNPMYPVPIEILANEQRVICCNMSNGDLWTYVKRYGEWSAIADIPLIGGPPDNMPGPAWQPPTVEARHPYGSYVYLLFSDWDWDDPEHTYVGAPPGLPHDYYTLRAHWDYGGSSVNTPNEWLDQTWQYGNEYTRPGFDFEPTVYVNFKVLDAQSPPPSPGSPGDVLIQYFYFYPFNDWINNHEGDWELVNVIVSDNDPALATIVGVEYFLHHQYTIPPPSGYVTVDETHPVVFVGGHGLDNFEGEGHFSHASYPVFGHWIRVLEEYQVFQADEVIMARATYNNPGPVGPIEGPYIHWRDFDIQFISVDHEDDGVWRADIPFGTPEVPSYDCPRDDCGQYAPRGPLYGGRWARVASQASNDDHYPLNYTPPYTPATSMGWVPFGLFHDSFGGKRQDETGNLARWTLGLGSWTIVQGELKGQGNGSQSPLNGAYFQLPTVWYDFPFENRNNVITKIKGKIRLQGTLPQSTGVGMALNNHPDSPVRVVLYRDGSSYSLRLQIKEGTSFVTCATASIGNPGTTDHTVEIVHHFKRPQWSFYDVSYDGALLLNSIYIADGGGDDKYGLVADGSSIAYFDNINVSYFRREPEYQYPPFVIFSIVPSSGETYYYCGSNPSVRIQWLAVDEKGEGCGANQGISVQRLELSLDGGQTWSYPAGFPPAGLPCGVNFYDWVVPSLAQDEPDAVFRIRVTDYEGVERVLTATPFTIKASTVPAPITVESPAAGVLWQRGQVRTIQWSTQCGPLDLHLSVDGGVNYTYPIALGVANTGQYVWSIPLDAPLGANCRI